VKRILLLALLFATVANFALDREGIDLWAMTLAMAILIGYGSYSLFRAHAAVKRRQIEARATPPILPRAR